MVFIVVAHKVSEVVEGAIVGVRLLLWVKGVVLCNEVPGDGVYSSSHKAA